MGAFHKLDGLHENISGIKERDGRFPTWPFIVHSVTCIANVTQYFEPLVHLFQDISTDNAIHGSNFGLYTIHKPFPRISTFPSITDKVTSVH